MCSFALQYVVPAVSMIPLKRVFTVTMQRDGAVCPQVCLHTSQDGWLDSVATCCIKLSDRYHHTTVLKVGYGRTDPPLCWRQVLRYWHRVLSFKLNPPLPHLNHSFWSWLVRTCMCTHSTCTHTHTPSLFSVSPAL